MLKIKKYESEIKMKKGKGTKSGAKVAKNCIKKFAKNSQIAVQTPSKRY